MLRKLAATAIAATALVGLLAMPASAKNLDGTCNASAYSLDPVGEFCLYYNSNQAGSLFDWAFPGGPIANLQGYIFLTPGKAGYGQAVKNNSASAWDRYYGDSVYVFYNSNYAGSSDFVGSLQKAQLQNTYNEDASFRWVS